MKIIGLLGCMSWESTASYYKAINEGVRAARGRLHSVRIAMISVDFAEIEALQGRECRESSAAILRRAARAIEAVGGDLLVICTSTMHKVAAVRMALVGSGKAL